MDCMLCQDKLTTIELGDLRVSQIERFGHAQTFTQLDLIRYGVVPSRTVASRLVEKSEFKGLVREIGQLPRAGRGRPTAIYAGASFTLTDHARPIDELLVSRCVGYSLYGTRIRFVTEIDGVLAGRGIELNYKDRSPKYVAFFMVEPPSQRLEQAVRHLTGWRTRYKDLARLVLVFRSWGDAEAEFRDEHGCEEEGIFFGAFPAQLISPRAGAWIKPYAGLEGDVMVWAPIQTWPICNACRRLVSSEHCVGSSNLGHPNHDCGRQRLGASTTVWLNAGWDQTPMPPPD